MESKNENKEIKQIKVVRHKWPDEIAEEKKRKRKKVFLVISFILVFVIGTVLGSVVTNLNNDDNETEIVLTNKESGDKNLSKFEEANEILKDDWYYAESDKTLIDNAITGMTYSSKDTHTNYLTKEDTKKLVGSLNGEFVGVGIQYQEQNGNYIITNVFVDSPAWKAGIKKGFILKKVDGMSVKNHSRDEVSKMIKGKKGDQVTLTMENLENKEKDYDVTRDEVDTSVFSEVKDGVGILKIDTFGENTAESVEKNLEAFKDDSVNEVIIDLRNNGGGYVDTAINIASLLLPKDTTVLYEKDKDGNLKAFKTKNKDPYEYKKVVVLVNCETASASEILTAALRNHLKNCKVVGEKTYGKGTVQHTKEFEDGSMLKYTVAEWLTSNKKSINNKGITPDIEIKMNEALTYKAELDKNASYKVDQVGENIKAAQIYLKFLGYKVDRCDGYYSKVTQDAVNKYRKDNHMDVNGIIDYELDKKLQESAVKYWYSNEEKLDVQKKEAIKLIKEEK